MNPQLGVPPTPAHGTWQHTAAMIVWVDEVGPNSLLALKKDGQLGALGTSVCVESGELCQGPWRRRRS